MQRPSLFVLILIAFTRCTSSLNDPDDTANTDFASAVSEVAEAAGAGATGLSRDLWENNERATCSSIAFGTCANSQKTRNFSEEGENLSPCTRGKGNGQRVFGQAILTFSDPLCGFDNLGQGATVTKTLNNHYVQRGLAGKKVVTYTGTGTVNEQEFIESDLEDFEGTSRSGGTTIMRGAGSVDKLTIHGIHRRGVTPKGRFTFWHTLFTEEDGITVSRNGSGDSRTATLNGTLYIMHNRKSLKVTKTLTDVIFEKGCSHPTSGSATITIPKETGEPESLIVIYSNTCGTASINGVASQLDLE